MSSTSKKNQKSDFEADDLINMTFQSQIQYEINQSKTNIDSKHVEIGGIQALQSPASQKLLAQTSFQDLRKQLDHHENKALNIGYMTQFLTLLNESAAAARILSKEYQSQSLVTTCHLDSIQHKIKEKRRLIQKANHDEQEETKSSIIQFRSTFGQRMKQIPHIKEAFEYVAPPKGQKEEAINMDPMLRNMPGQSPGQARMRIEKNPNAHLNREKTGVDIRGGNYINMNNEQAVPTWQKGQNKEDFYAQQFQNQNGQNQNKKRGYDESFPNQQYGPGASNGTQYQPPFNSGSGQPQKRKDHKFIDQVYQQYQNPNNIPNNPRIERIINDCGGDVDYAKLNKYADKKGWQNNQQGYNGPPPQQSNRDRMDSWHQQYGPQGNNDHMRMDNEQKKGLETFRTGLNQYQEDMKKQKGLKHQDDRGGGGGGYGGGGGGGYGGGGGGRGYGGGGGGGYGGGGGAENYYGNNRREKEPKDDRSATEKLFDNTAGKSGLSGRRRFVCPSKEGGTSYGGEGNKTNGMAGFDPGRSVVNHMTTNAKATADGKSITTEKDDKKPMAIGPDGKPLPEGEEADERYKNLDPRMVETIMNEIMEKDLKITWDDIAGLEFAKKTINEIIIWPMLRPDIFKGIRAPPRGIMFFGPPGTGKTLLGKAIACQSKSTFMSISASTLTSKWVGEGEKMVRTMFAIAAIHQPAVVFIDEIDSLLSARSDADQEGSRRIKTEFLIQLDGANTFGSEEARILIIGATNRPDDLDEAVRRRLSKRLYIPLPNAAGRKQFLERLIEKEFQSDDQMKNMIDLDNVGIDKLIQLTKGYSGADLKVLSTEAAMMPLREIADVQNCNAESIRPLNLADFEAGLLNVRASVNQKDIARFMDWNNMYGSFPVTEEDLKD